MAPSIPGVVSYKKKLEVGGQILSLANSQRLQLAAARTAEADAFLRQHRQHVVEDQLNLQCLRHSLNSLFAGTDRCQDQALGSYIVAHDRPGGWHVDARRSAFALDELHAGPSLQGRD
jgi:hypothetical protein